MSAAQKLKVHLRQYSLIPFYGILRHRQASTGNFFAVNDTVGFILQRTTQSYACKYVAKCSVYGACNITQTSVLMLRYTSGIRNILNISNTFEPTICKVSVYFKNLCISATKYTACVFFTITWTNEFLLLEYVIFSPVGIRDNEIYRKSSRSVSLIFNMFPVTYCSFLEIINHVCMVNGSIVGFITDS